MLDTLFALVAKVVVFLGYPGIAFLMILESIILPLPSEIILPFAGYLVSNGDLNLWWVVIAATIGSVLGSWIAYEVSRAGGRKFLQRYGRYLLLDEKHLLWTEGWFKRFGEKTIFFCRMLPVIRHFISVPAGTSKMHRGQFLAYTFAGSFVWNFALTYIGFLLGKEWKRIGLYTQPVVFALVLIIIALVLWIVFREVERRTMGWSIRKMLRRKK
jgi:membrane protein DedA with SNARE-associated domain